ncbi:MAG: hypothetical protein DWQ04_09235 [Chloroflexi bacterium]|nr:MAG: hypothetical protein DWQ04_09235 [Chloroflexota bacterium]
MAQSKSKNKQIIDIILMVFVLLCVGMILVELTNNLSTQLESQNQSVTTIQEAEPTPLPTLTAEEREEMFSAPIGEDGNE